jgi:hypothetical protein
MEPIPVMKGSLSQPVGEVGNDAHNLIMIEGLADEISCSSQSHGLSHDGGSQEHPVWLVSACPLFSSSFGICQVA